MSLAKKYKRPPPEIGDQVVIRPDLVEYDRSEDCEISDENPCGRLRLLCEYSIVDNMVKFRSRSATIVDKRSAHVYKIDIDNGAWAWSKEMFVGYEEPLRCLYETPE